MVLHMSSEICIEVNFLLRKYQWKMAVCVPFLVHMTNTLHVQLPSKRLYLGTRQLYVIVTVSVSKSPHHQGICTLVIDSAGAACSGIHFEGYLLFIPLENQASESSISH